MAAFPACALMAAGLRQHFCQQLIPLDAAVACHPMWGWSASAFALLFIHPFSPLTGALIRFSPVPSLSTVGFSDVAAIPFFVERGVCLTLPCAFYLKVREHRRGLS